MRKKKSNSNYQEWQKACGGCDNLHDLFFDSTPDTILILNSDFKVIYASKGAPALFECTADQILGRVPHELFTPMSFVYFEKRYKNGVSDSFEVEREIQIKYGKMVEVLSKETPVYSVDKKLKGLIIYLRDITEKKRSEEMLNLESSALEATAIGIAITNERGDIVWVNSAFQKLTGYKEEELLYKNMRILNSGKQDDYFYSGMWEKILSGKVWHGELINKRKDGKLYSEEQIITPVIGKGKTISNFIVTKVNISKRKQMEEDLRQMNDELEELVKKRTDQLVESEKMAALGELVAGIAHEINNPIGISYTAVSYLRDQSRMLVSASNNNQLTKLGFTKYLEEIDQLTASLEINVRRAADLISSFKQIAVDQSSEGKREFFVKEYFEEIIVSLKPQLSNKEINISLTCPEMLAISSYPGAFSQIMTNLVMNSLVHGFENNTKGSINIDITAIDEVLLISYFDDGKGVSKKNIKRIFDPFFSTKFGQGGSGLGLHIIYNLVTHKLGGGIKCQSELNKGINFTISIPLAGNE